MNPNRYIANILNQNFEFVLKIHYSSHKLQKPYWVHIILCTYYRSTFQSNPFKKIKNKNMLVTFNNIVMAVSRVLQNCPTFPLRQYKIYINQYVIIIFTTCCFKQWLTMDEDNEQNYIINVRLMKLIGFYQLLNPKTPTKLFGYNVFRLVGKMSLLYIVLMIVACIISIYYALYDSEAVINYTMIIVVNCLALFKLYFIIRNANVLWDLMSVTFIDFLPYSGHYKSILIRARALSTKTSTIVSLCWLAVISVWILTPITIQGNYMLVKSKDLQSYSRYRCNVANLIYPVTDEFFNDNFGVFYLLETVLSIVYGYAMMAFDFLIISMGLTIIYQIKMVALSYSSLDGHNNIIKTDLKSKCVPVNS